MSNNDDILKLASVDYVDELLEGKQDKLTAGNNITIENNVISASSSGGSSKRYYYDVLSTQPSSLKPMSNVPGGFIAINLQINYNYAFPEEGEIHVTHIMVPALTTTRDNVYIGYASSSAAYKGPAPKSSFWLMTSQPLTLPEGETSKTYTDVECDFFGGVSNGYTTWPVQPIKPGEPSWTGWQDSEKPGPTKKIAYYTKSIVDGVEMFTWVADYEGVAPIYSANEGEYEKWSNNPQFAEYIEETDYSMVQMMVRGSMYPRVPLIFGVRYEFTPIGAEWPKKHTCTSFIPPNES